MNRPSSHRKYINLILLYIYIFVCLLDCIIIIVCSSSSTSSTSSRSSVSISNIFPFMHIADAFVQGDLNSCLLSTPSGPDSPRTA